MFRRFVNWFRDINWGSAIGEAIGSLAEALSDIDFGDSGGSD